MGSTTCSICKRHAHCTIPFCATAWRRLDTPFRTICGSGYTKEPCWKLVSLVVGTAASSGREV